MLIFNRFNLTINFFCNIYATNNFERRMELAKNSFKLKSVNKPDVSTILHTSVYYLIAAVLLFSGIVKILDPLPLIETLKLITIIPGNLQILITVLLPVVEIGLALLLMLRVKREQTLTLITILFGIFLFFSIYGTVSGLDNDCGCFKNHNLNKST